MIYTKLGDNGFTSTLMHKNLQKNNKIFDVLGTFDEVTSSLALAKFHISDTITLEIINKIQNDIIIISSALSGDKIEINYSEKILFLENIIDKYENLLPENNKFIVFGDEKISTLLNCTRTIVRRLERKIIDLKQLNFMFRINNLLYSWINRLSDLIFILSRYFILLNNNNNNNNINLKNTISNNNKISKIQKINNKIFNKAKELNVNIVVAICDSGGNIISVLKDDCAYIASIDIAINKAYTSVILKMSTKKLSQLSINNSSELYGIQYTNNGRINILGGGIPIFDKNNNIIFGLGISGGSIDEDVIISEYGYKKFMEEFFI